ncbi:MAG: hypothetical protein AB7G75_08845 [Candidatus Binatia bacterium]
MSEPRWIDERGRPAQLQPCFFCSRPVPVMRLKLPWLDSNGWDPTKPFMVSSHCGHDLLYLPWPEDEE